MKTILLSLFFALYVTGLFAQYYSGEDYIQITINKYGQLLLPESEDQLFSISTNDDPDLVTGAHEYKSLFFHYNKQNQVSYVVRHTSSNLLITPPPLTKDSILFLYNDKQQIIQQITYSEESGFLGHSFTTTFFFFQYDEESGLLKSKITTDEASWDSGSFHIKDVYNYNEAGNPTIHKRYIMNELESFITYHYHTNGKLQEEKHYGPDPNPTVLSFGYHLNKHILYRYNKKGQITQIDRPSIETSISGGYTGIDTAALPAFRMVFDYTHSTPEILFYEGTNSNLILVNQVKFIKDGKGNVICEKHLSGDPLVSGRNEVVQNYSYQYKLKNPTPTAAAPNAHSMSILPNPVQREATLYFEAAKQPLRMYFKLYTMNGQLVYEESFDALKGDNQHLLDLGNIPNGLYIARIRQGEREFSKKLLIHR